MRVMPETSVNNLAAVKRKEKQEGRRDMIITDRWELTSWPMSLTCSSGEMMCHKLNPVIPIKNLPWKVDGTGEKKNKKGTRPAGKYGRAGGRNRRSAPRGG